MKLRLLLVSLFAFICWACEPHASGGPYYFATWSGYDLPRRPVEPITLAEAKKRRAYIEAYYDEKGRLTRIAKYLDGKLAWADSYRYQGNKLIGRTGTKPNGDVVEEVFD